MQHQPTIQPTSDNPATSLTASGVLQRKCACGQHVPGGGECASCKNKKQTQGLQKRLTIGQDNDPYEQEADRVAAQIMRTPAPGNGQKPSIASATPAISRRANSSTSYGLAAPPIVNEVISAPGQSLAASTRQSMEPRFGRDFGSVKIHTDSKAAASAKAVNAQAYTVGQSIVFNSGAYQPTTPGGQELLAHELTHTVQQSHGGDPTRLSRRGGTVGGFFNNIGRWFAGLVGLEPKYDEATLKEYLKNLKKDNVIQDDFDSDNKARAVVLQNLYQAESFDVRVLLIKELLSGFTGNDDEQAILTLLENANSKQEREKMAEKVTYAALYDNFHGKELDQLYVLLPLMKVFHPREEIQTTVHTFEDYIKKWEKEQSRKITPAERTTLAKGCIGITELNIGTTKSPYLGICYASFEKAWFKARDFNDFIKQEKFNIKAVIFSKRFWSAGRDYSPNSKTDEVDMSKYDYSARPGFVNFDYGFYDEATNRWWHANHCEPSIRGVRCKGSEAREKGLPDPMKVYESNLAGYSQPLQDFDQQVFCIGFSRI